MDTAILGVVLDSSSVITAERRKLSVPGLVEAIQTAHGEIEISLSPVTVAELVHGIYRAKNPEAVSGGAPISKSWPTWCPFIL